jgi:hypothetical protein
MRSDGFWQNPNKDASAIQRWQREQIEHSQYDVKNQSVLQVVRQPNAWSPQLLEKFFTDHPDLNLGSRPVWLAAELKR